MHFTAQSVAMLAASNWVMMMDINPAVGVALYVPFTFSAALFTDNSYGNAFTANGAGVEGNASLMANNTKMQNSIPMSVFGIDPNIAGEYSVVFMSSPVSNSGNIVSRTETTLTYGAPTASVPDGGSMAAMMSLGLIGVAGLRRQFGTTKTA